VAARPALFVTSVEVREDPVLGRIAQAGGCDFVERRHVGTLRAECARIAEHLRHVPVLVFPEGTSSDGSGVLPFRPAFFTSALEAGGAIQPLCIDYPRIDGRPFGPTNHARVCWYGDMAFEPHLLQLLTVRRLEARVQYLEPLAVAAQDDRKRLANDAHRAISDARGTDRLPVGNLGSVADDRLPGGSTGRAAALRLAARTDRRPLSGMNLRQMTDFAPGR